MNTKQTIFVNEYLKCWNASEAARRAGYNGKSNVIGSRLLTDVSIREEIRRRIDESLMSADEVLVRLANMARSNIADFAKVQTSADLAALGDKGALVKKFKQKKTYTQAGNEYEEIELELYPADVNLERIGRYHGLFTDKIELKLEKEVESFLTTLEQSLDADTYQRVLQALSAGRHNPEVSGAAVTEDSD